MYTVSDKLLKWVGRTWVYISILTKAQYIFKEVTRLKKNFDLLGQLWECKYCMRNQQYIRVSGGFSRLIRVQSCLWKRAEEDDFTNVCPAFSHTEGGRELLLYLLLLNALKLKIILRPSCIVGVERGGHILLSLTMIGIIS